MSATPTSSPHPPNKATGFVPVLLLAVCYPVLGAPTPGVPPPVVGSRKAPFSKTPLKTALLAAWRRLEDRRSYMVAPRAPPFWVLWLPGNALYNTFRSGLE